MLKVYFNDGDTITKEDCLHSNWNSLPNKPIKKIEYSLLGYIVILENFESYNHLVENEDNCLTNTMLLAKKYDKVYMYRFDFFNNSMETKLVEFGKEYYGSSVHGWKEGLLNENTSYNLIKTSAIN